MRPRNGWVALADADPALVFAAAHGVVLSCITQAKRLGLWVMDASEIHVAARHPKSQVVWKEGVRHWARPLIMRPPWRLEDPIENVLELVSNCQPRELALTVLDSALNRGLVTLQGLDTLPLSTRFRDLLGSSSPFADSGLETLFRTRLSWLGVPIRTQAWVLGRRVDLLIGDRLIVQIDGLHHEGAQRGKDIRHDTVVQLEGYRVLRFSYAQVVHHWEEVEEAILRAIARGHHLAEGGRR